VRIFNMLLLARERPGDPDTLAVLRDACSDQSPEVRLRAAIELGAEGRGVLLQLAQSPAHDASSARAVALLGRELPLESLRDILASAVQSLPKKRGGLLRTASACLEELGHRGAAAVDVLAHVMAEEKGELAAAAALALGMTGEASAEPPLLQALQSEDGGLREAAAAALGRVGTAAAVQPLKEAADRSWLDPPSAGPRARRSPRSSPAS
jgi:HEAT repeat protein